MIATETRQKAAALKTILHARVITGSGGGPDKTMLNSARFLKPLGYRSICAYLRPPGDPGFEVIRNRANELESPLLEIDDRGPLDWRIVPAALKICRENNVSVWHAHDYKTNLLGLILRRRWPMHLVSTVHGWVELTARTRLYHRLDRLTLPRYARVACVSPDLLEQVRNGGVDVARSQLIENAIDTTQFQRRQTRAAAKRKLGLDESRLLVGAVGRLSPEKGFDRLIDSMYALQKNNHCPKLVIVGDGDQQAALQSQISRLGLEPNVMLAGFQSNTSDWYEAMDVFVLSSLREGLPNVVLEAMALETPVIATNVAGVPRVIEDGANGTIVPIGDQEALNAALTRLLGDPKLRKRFAESGRKTIESKFSFSNRMRCMAELYDSLDGDNE